MKQLPSQTPDLESRRRFLRDTLTLGAGAATVVLTANTASAAVVDEATVEAPPVKSKKGYHVTSHINDYYKTAAF